MHSPLLFKSLKPIVFLAALAPASWLFWAALTGNLSANPLSDITNETGVWTLRFLCITLAVTPVRRLTGWNGIIRFRRMLGLFAFFYGTLHFTVFFFLDHQFDFAAMWTDVLKRPYIAAGFTAFVLMIPLAITSTTGWIRRMGGKKWNLLHKLIYVTALAGVLHYYWKVKLDASHPIYYGAVVVLLLGFRVWRNVARKRASEV